MKTLSFQNMLEVLANFNLNHTDLGMFDLCGLCRYEDKEIFVAKDMSEAQKIATIIHECVHGYNCLHELSQKEKEVRRIERNTYRSLYESS